MATRNKLKDVLPQEVARLSNQGGQKHAADVLGVSQASISTTLKNAGYIRVSVWKPRTDASVSLDLEQAS